MNRLEKILCGIVLTTATAGAFIGGFSSGDKSGFKEGFTKGREKGVKEGAQVIADEVRSMGYVLDYWGSDVVRFNAIDEDGRLKREAYASFSDALPPRDNEKDPGGPTSRKVEIVVGHTLQDVADYLRFVGERIEIKKDWAGIEYVEINHYDKITNFSGESYVDITVPHQARVLANTLKRFQRNFVLKNPNEQNIGFGVSADCTYSVAEDDESDMKGIVNVVNPSEPKLYGIERTYQETKNEPRQHSYGNGNDPILMEISGGENREGILTRILRYFGIN